jgi:hypothetical protein
VGHSLRDHVTAMEKMHRRKSHAQPSTATHNPTQNHGKRQAPVRCNNAKDACSHGKIQLPRFTQGLLFQEPLQCLDGSFRSTSTSTASTASSSSSSFEGLTFHKEQCPDRLTLLTELGITDADLEPYSIDWNMNV